MLCSSCKHYDVMFNKSHCNHPKNLYKQKRIYHSEKTRDYTIEEKQTPEDKNSDGCCKDFEDVKQKQLFKNYEIVPEIKYK